MLPSDGPVVARESYIAGPPSPAPASQTRYLLSLWLQPCCKPSPLGGPIFFYGQRLDFLYCRSSFHSAPPVAYSRGYIMLGIFYQVLLFRNMIVYLFIDSLVY